MYIHNLLIVCYVQIYVRYLQLKYEQPVRAKYFEYQFHQYAINNMNTIHASLKGIKYQHICCILKGLLLLEKIDDLNSNISDAIV